MKNSYNVFLMIYKYTAVCLMALIILFFIHLLIIKLNNSQIAAENRKWLEFDSSHRDDLYSSVDKVAILTADNFNENVFNSTSSWIVQFYNSWCGHCVKFSPIWKELAANIYNWRDIVTIAAINCADDQNTQLCRDYEIMRYPTIRYFDPMTFNITLGDEFTTVSDVDTLRHQVVLTIESIEKNEIPRNWPNLLPLHESSIEELRQNIEINRVLTLVVVENSESFVGYELILDLKDVKNITVRRTADTSFGNLSYDNLPKIIALKNFSLELVPITNTDRKNLYSDVQKYLSSAGYKIPNLLDENKTSIINNSRVKQSLKQQILVNQVFQSDLESALRYSLYNEITIKPLIENESLSALVNYLIVLEKYFPFDNSSNKFLNEIIKKLMEKTTLTGGEFKDILNEEDPPQLANREWISCKGSVSRYRGYPCGLWMMFHALTVRAYINNQSSSQYSTEVLSAMKGYIKYFFGCGECAQHFQEMSKNITKENISSHKESILWLWQAHNDVNRRLANDLSEDPSFPKVQFPIPSMCSDCKINESNWNEENVLKYLVNMYSQIRRSNSFFSATERYYQKESKWGFNLSDINACISLYILLACLLTAYTVRFFFKRKTYKVKNFKSDCVRKV